MSEWKLNVLKFNDRFELLSGNFTTHLALFSNV